MHAAWKCCRENFYLFRRPDPLTVDVDSRFSSTTCCCLLSPYPDGSVDTSPDLTDAAIFPGSFNPLHRGHTELRRVGAEILGRRVVYEISVSNVAKPGLTREQISQRLTQFPDDVVLLSHAPTFVQKAELLPNSPFVVGFDTAVRILDARFYGNSQARMLAALARFKAERRKFLVGGRLMPSGVQSEFSDIEMLKIPDGFEELFEGISGKDFREDISSTELRGE